MGGCGREHRPRSPPGYRIRAALRRRLRGRDVAGPLRRPRERGGAFESTVTGFAVGTVCLLPTALLDGLLPDMERPAWTAGLILYLGAVPTALAYPLFGLCVLRVTTASVVASVEPLTAAVVGSLVFGDRLTAIVLTGRVILPLAVLFRAADERVGREASRRAPSADHGQRTWPPAIRVGD
ncbi:EamA family transporter [Streptomyces sp. NPDC012474]|uniref:EamA family transporter n=1 Tax=Streptomyces sp. NPDC012474 TaxID=3364836 RepID=UPI0036EF3DA6